MWLVLKNFIYSSGKQYCMGNLSVGTIVIIFSLIVIGSYLFSILSNFIKVPSVLLLLIAGIVFRYLSDKYNWGLNIPEKITAILGAVGLVMIVLEAGLDLRLGKSKIPLIRNSIFAAIFIFLLSVACISCVLIFWLHEVPIKCIVYAIPLSIMSSAIVIPSIQNLSETKKEFLIYEASFSDILGILVFNYCLGSEIVTLHAMSGFFINIIFAIILSLLFSALLFLIMARSPVTVKFFLIFALLLLLYEGGEMLGLPALLVILIFGLMMKNWDLLRIPYMNRWFPLEEVDEINKYLQSITAETSFLIRTFFFLIFGFSIDIKVIMHSEVLLIGSIIIAALVIARFLYLKYLFKGSIYPEVIFIPRGLVTILLFYQIPDSFKLKSFNDGILFYIILGTTLIMMIGLLFYKNKSIDKSEVLKM
ncbi:hypothetical protein A9P82_01430 [Arachidicoccus ginsenosidimutans]|uniref:cation:proton antiporter domain-containing protein n=1 Tax=Arachidicoccus sp. BS20 TaxID=1850526 RepID=UPI0007F0AC5A|nr:cation:proton antiporter [Arachidicoccus sp. BS20]ANI88090.1 hypothetical protein A9P82_01430 [Arachidicoccus sp. BS20]